MNTDLRNKYALVCGSTRGIGRAIAFELATLGANVILMARDKNALKSMVSQLDHTSSQQHHFLVADFDTPESVRSEINNYINRGNTVHILINNSGGPAPGTAVQATPDAYLLAFRRHLICNQHLVQAVTPGMKSSKYGRIINIISTSVRTPIPGLGVSNTTRGAVASWAKTLSVELGSFGITVNNILPGLTDTGRLRSLIKTRAKDLGISVEEMEKRMKAGIPAGRFADPAETAALAGYLASPSAAFINGESIRVDGGATPSI